MPIPYEDLVGYSATKRRAKMLKGNVPFFGGAVHALSEYATLAAAKLAIGNVAKVVLTVAEPFTAGASVDFADTNISFEFIADGFITVSAGVTLSGMRVEAGIRQVFDVSASNAKVLFARGQDIEIAWLCGTVLETNATKAINLALESCNANLGGNIWLPDVRYTSNGGHIVTKGTQIHGRGDFITIGYGGTSIKLVAPAAAYLFKIGEDTYDTFFEAMTLDGGGIAAKTGVLMEGSAPASSGKAIFHRVTFSGFLSYGVNYNTLTVGTTWQMAQVGFDHCRWLGNGVGVRQTSVNSSWVFNNCFFYIPANCWAMVMENGGITKFSGGEMAGAGLNAKCVQINGAHVNLKFSGMQEEGTHTFIEQNASDPSGLIKIDSCLIQSRVISNATCQIHSVGSNYLSKFLKLGGVGNNTQFISDGDHIQNRDVADGVTAVNPPVITEGGLNDSHVIYQNNGILGYSARRLPHRFISTLPQIGAPNTPVVRFSHITGGGEEDKLLAWFGLLDTNELPTFGYGVYRKLTAAGGNIGWLHFKGDQAFPYRGFHFNSEIKSTTPEPIVIPVNAEDADLTTGTGKVVFRMFYPFTLLAVKASVSTAPAGSTIIVDVNKSGASILSTRLTIDAGEKTSSTAAVSPVISDPSLPDDVEISIDVDQVGSGTPGKGLKVYLIGYRI